MCIYLRKNFTVQRKRWTSQHVLSTRYWFMGTCAAIFFIIIVVQRYILVEISNIAFYGDPFKVKCESNTYFFRTKESMECLARNTIFFLETSNATILNARQACAVESAALHHPDWQVRVLFSTSEQLTLKDPYMNFLTSLDNVKLLRMELDFFMPETPLRYWYESGIWKYSPHRVVHLSDAIRLCLLWEYGGIYLDTDVVVLRSLSRLRNTLSFDSGSNIGSSFLAFDRGQTLLRYALIHFDSSYNPGEFASNGPLLLNRIFRGYCEPSFNNTNDNICYINILPKESVYPIDFIEWKDYFKPQNIAINENAFNSSFVIHIWNHLSSTGKMFVGQNSLYEMAMKKHCPKVYKIVMNVGYA